MGVFQNNLMGAAAAAASAGGGDFYSYQIANSLRLPLRTSGFSKTYSGSDGDDEHFTLSWWQKGRPPGHNQPMDVIDARDGTDNSSLNELYFADPTASAGTGGDALCLVDSSSGNKILCSTNLFRDPAAWYHFVVRADMDNATASERLKFYVNGTEMSYATDNRSSYSSAAGFGNAGSWYLFRYHNGSYGLYSNVAEMHYIDGTSLTPSSFGETKNGVWIPKEYDTSDGAYGTLGFYLKFESSSDLGNDSSGNNNDWTTIDLAAHDQMLDTPTFNSDSNGGNFPTYNPLLKPPTGLALAEGNLKATLTSDDNGIMTNWQVPVTGKWYWEVDVDNIASAHGVYIGVMPANTDLTINQESNNLGLVYYSINGNSILKGTRASYGDTYTTGDIISIAVDRDADTLQFYKNGSGQGTISISTLDEEFFCYMGYTGGSGPCSTILNFGQEGTFAGNVTAGGNSDGTGYGNFKYSVPSGFLALCSGNQPVADAVDPAQTDDNYPQKLFGATIWTGDGTTSRAITGLGFQPDWVWFKARSSAFSNRLYDTTRGITSNGGYRLFSNTTAAQVDKTSSGQDISAVGSDGFTLGASSNLYTNDTNSGGLHVAWTWRANGGTTSTNSNGSTDSTVQVDPSGHFSIVKFEGQNDSWGNAETIGHGLSSAPTCMILKNYDKADEWSVFFSDYGSYSIGGSNAASNSLVLNSDAELYTNQSYKGWGGVMPTSTVFTVDGNNNNGASESIIVYCFANCEGYIKTGSYVGNANADGTFVYTGFKPEFFMCKPLLQGNWRIQDIKRSPYNVANKTLYPNHSNAEESYSSDSIDILSNGVKMRASDSNYNQATTFVYLAMAHNPFKYATAR